MHCLRAQVRMFPHFHIGALSLSSWRITVLAGLLLCWVLFLLRARRMGYPFLPILYLLVLALPVGTVGGQLFNTVIPRIFGLAGAYRSTGLTVIGSIVLVLLFGMLYARYVLKVPALPLLDAVAFTFPLSIMIGRMGCLLSGCCFGKFATGVAGSPFLSLCTLSAGIYAPTSQAGIVLRDAPAGSMVWNLPLFLMLNALFVLITAESLFRNRERWRLVPGTVMAATAAQYSGGRFLLEFLRRDDLVGSTWFNPWQLAVLVLFILSLSWLGLCLYRRRVRLAG